MRIQALTCLFVVFFITACTNAPEPLMEVAEPVAEEARAPECEDDPDDGIGGTGCTPEAE